MVRALALVFVAAATTTAVAQPPNTEGVKLFEEGRALAKDGKWAEACDKFEKSHELDPAIGTRLNWGDCHEKLDHNAQAWRLFDSAADAEKMTNPERAKFSRGRADALLPKVGVVNLKIASPDAPMLAVSIQGRVVKPAPLVREIVDPGAVAIAVTAQGSPPFQKTEQVEAGKSVTIEVPAFVVGPTGPELGGGDGQAPVDGGSPQRRRSRVLLAYGVGGAGAVALIAGVAIGLKARSDYNAQFDNGKCMDTSPQPTCPDPTGATAQLDAISLARTGTIFGVAGGVLIAAGAVLFLTAPKDVVVTPTATAQSAGLSVVGRF